MSTERLLLRPDGTVTGLRPACAAGHLKEGLKKNRNIKKRSLHDDVTFDSNKTPREAQVTTLISGIINRTFLQGKGGGAR